MFVDCHASSPKQLYELLVNAVVPRPIAWVSSISKEGISNLAPFSFFNAFSASPPILGFSPGLKRGSDNQPVQKDTLRNVIDTAEFVVNIVSLPYAEIMVQSSANYDAKTSEFEQLKLTALASTKIKAPRLAESPINLECKLFKIVDLGSNQLVLGEIVCMHIDDAICTDGIIDVLKLQPLARLGGELYAAIRDPFRVERT